MGRISRRRIWNLLAPIKSAAITKYSFFTEEAIPYTNLVYHGHHITVTAIIAFIKVGFNIAAIASASIKGGTLRNISVIRMITVSIQVFWKYPAINPKETPGGTAIARTKTAIIKAPRNAKMTLEKISLPILSVPKRCCNEGGCPVLSKSTKGPACSG
ncbi:hypothetical protein ES705_42103 [subsurface metagenome]